MRFSVLVLIGVLLLNGGIPITAQDDSPLRREVFERMRLLVQKDGKLSEVEVQLRLEGDEVALEPRTGGTPLKSFQRLAITGISYSYSKHPRWKGATAAGGAAVAAIIAPSLVLGLASLVALPVALAVTRHKSNRHWLTITSPQDYAVLRLDKRDYLLVLAALESRTGLKAERFAGNLDQEK